MYVSVSEREIRLDDPEDTMSFKVVVTGTVQLDHALRVAEWGAMAGDDALISVDALRRAASGRVSTDWAANFQKMLSYAQSKGWLTEDGSAIRGHVEHNA